MKSSAPRGASHATLKFVLFDRVLRCLLLSACMFTQRTVLAKFPLTVFSVASSTGFGGGSSMMEYKSTTLGQQLTEAMSDDSLADVTFVVGPERKIVKGLRIVMAARNKFLRKMIYDSKNEDGAAALLAHIILLIFT